MDRSTVKCILVLLLKFGIIQGYEDANEIRNFSLIDTKLYTNTITPNVEQTAAKQKTAVQVATTKAVGKKRATEATTTLATTKTSTTATDSTTTVATTKATEAATTVATTKSATTTATDSSTTVATTIATATETIVATTKATEAASTVATTKTVTTAATETATSVATETEAATTVATTVAKTVATEATTTTTATEAATTAATEAATSVATGTEAATTVATTVATEAAATTTGTEAATTAATESATSVATGTEAATTVATETATTTATETATTAATEAATSVATTTASGTEAETSVATETEAATTVATTVAKTVATEATTTTTATEAATTAATEAATSVATGTEAATTVATTVATEAAATTTGTEAATTAATESATSVATGTEAATTVATETATTTATETATTAATEAATSVATTTASGTEAETTVATTKTSTATNSATTVATTTATGTETTEATGTKAATTVATTTTTGTETTVSTATGTEAQKTEGTKKATSLSILSTAFSASITTPSKVPGEPTDFNATVNNSSKITLFWSPSGHNAGPTHYSIFVNGSVDNKTDNCTVTEVINVQGYNTSREVVANLCSYTRYNFTIMASTSAGNSSIVSLNQTVQTGIGIPGEPTDFNATVNNSSKITLFWSPSGHNAGPTHYSIFVNGSVDNKTDNCTVTEVINVQGYNTSREVVANLCSYTRYNFTIMASTSAGNSSIVSLNQTVQTGIGIPGEPTDFNATVNNSSKITLFWSPSGHNAGPTHYSIFVNGSVDNKTDNCTVTEVINVQGYNTSREVVANLCSYTRYNFTIMASTSAGNSSIVSLNQTVQTGIGIPGEPTDFNATVNNSSKITLFWSPSGHIAGPTHYSIIVNGSVHNKTDSCTVTEVINVQGYNTSCEVVANLCSYTRYNFTIMASTSAGNSSIVSLNQTVQTGIGIPGEPTDFNATVNNSSKITLFWSPSGHNAGPTHYSIFVNGSVDNKTDNCTVTEVINVQGYNTSREVVANLCSYTRYNFTIMASTSAGNSSIVSLNQTVQTGIGIPGEPTDFNATVNNSSKITLFWSPSGHNAGPTHYSIFVNGSVDNKTDNCTVTEVINVQGYNTSCEVVANLCSYTRYNFTIMASTSAGNSSIVSLNQTVQTGIGIPGEPTDFNATVNNSSKITLLWSPSGHNAGPTHYSIFVNGSVDNKTDNCTVTEVINVQGYNTSCEVVANLCSYTRYNFTIMASTSAGNSSIVSLNQTVQTGIGIPGEPTDFNATVNNSSKITLLWSPSGHNAGPTHYSIFVNGSVDNKTDNCTVTEVINVQGYNTSCEVVANLCSYTRYNFTIMASTSAGNSSIVSLNQTVQTGIGIPGEPTDFNATVNNSSKITLLWSPSGHNAGPTHYSIFVNGSVDNKTDNCTVTEVINVQGYNTSREVVANLCSYTRYNFTIMASTSAGNSSIVSLNQTVQTGIGIPGEPTDFNATVNNSSKITLFWSPSGHNAGPTHYSIFVNGSVDNKTDNCTVTEVINVQGYNTSREVVANLCSYTRYNFTIMASTSAGNSSIVSLNQTVQTGIGIPGEPTDFNATVNNSSKITLLWSPSGHNAGPTHYSIFVNGSVDNKTDNCTVTEVINVQGYNTSREVVANLCSYTRYNFTIMASTSAGNSSIVSLNQTVQTGIGIPGEPTDFNATVNNSSKITLFWSPSGHNAGPTHYSIFVNGSVDNKTDNCTVTEVINVQGYNTSREVVANLCSYTRYNFTIMASTSAGNSSIVSLNQTVQTGIGIPGEPTDFNATVNNSSKITLFWSPSGHNAGPTRYSIFVNGSVDNKTDNCTVTEVINVQGYNTSRAVVANLCSYTRYNFTIMASTSAGNSSIVSLNQTVQTGIGIPGEPTDFNAIVNNSSKITLFWSPSKHKAGPTNYSIVVIGNVDYRTDNCTNTEVINVPGYMISSEVVANLCSYTHYKFNINAKTSAGNSSSVSLNQTVQTGIEAAHPPQNITIEQVFPSSVKLSWVHSRHQCGPTDYIVDVEEHPHLMTQSYVLIRTITVHGFHNTTVDIGNLTSYWEYRVSVCARTSVHQNSSSVSAEIQTLQSTPGRVENVQVIALSDNFTAVLLTWECPKERERHGLISNFTVQYLDYERHISFPNRNNCTDAEEAISTIRQEQTYNFTEKNVRFPISNNCTGAQEAILTILPEHTYNFTIIANAQYQGLKGVSKEFYAKAGKPLQENPTEIFNTTALETSASTTDSTFFVTVNVDILRDATNGDVVMTGLLVMKENASTDYPENVNSLKKWRKWSEWKKDYKGSYRPTPDCWLIRNTDDDGRSTANFIVGDDANCENIQESHCNGPLEADTTYRVMSVSCTNAGCTTSTAHFQFKTKGIVSAETSVTAVVSGMLAALIVVGLVIGVVVYRRRRNRKQQNYIDDKPVDEDKEQNVDKNRSKKLSDFSRLVDEYRKDSGRLFSLEWQDIGLYSPSHPYNNAKLAVNRIKNRYTNILAYDHTRVKLLPKTEEEGSDYINANYILGFSRPREYIASQGPVPETVDDFWQMIWEQNVPIIVQLTGLFEKGKRKLAQYWPEEVNQVVTYGDLKVEIVSISPMNKYTIKMFRISLGSKSRHVKHFFLQGWQDYNANLKTGDVIDFTRYVRNELKPTDKGPMLVHCSAGVGRTGTFICVDYFLQVIDKADLEDSIDIFSFVLKMRDCRPMMVQSENQYIFVHDAVKEMVERKRTALAGEEDEVIYENQAFDPNEDGDDNIYENV